MPLQLSSLLHIIRILLAVDPPFVINNGDGTFAGYMPESIEKISLQAGFTYTLTAAANYNDGVYQTVSDHNA